MRRSFLSTPINAHAENGLGATIQDSEVPSRPEALQLPTYPTYAFYSCEVILMNVWVFIQTAGWVQGQITEEGEHYLLDEGDRLKQNLQRNSKTIGERRKKKIKKRGKKQKREEKKTMANRNKARRSEGDEGEEEDDEEGDTDDLTLVPPKRLRKVKYKSLRGMHINLTKEECAEEADDNDYSPQHDHDPDYDVNVDNIDDDDDEMEVDENDNE